MYMYKAIHEHAMVQLGSIILLQKEGIVSSSSGLVKFCYCASGFRS